MYITLYFIVTRLSDSLRSVRDHFLSLDPTSLTVDLLEQHLLAGETSAVAVGAARGTLRPPFFEGCSPSPLAPSYASAAAANVSVTEDVGAASASAKLRTSKGKGGRGGGGGSGGGGGGSGSGGGGSTGSGGGGGTFGGSGGSGGGGGGCGGSGGSGGGGTGGDGTGARRVGSGGGQRQQQQRQSETPSPQQLREWFLRGASGGSCPYVIRTGDRAGQTCGRLHTQHRCFSRLDDAWRAEFGDDLELPRWADLLKSRIAIFDLDFDAILSAMYALSISVEGDCYRTTLNLLPAPVPVRQADPSGGPVVARSSTILPCLAVPSGSLSGLHLPSFSTNLVSTAALQDAMVTTATPGGQRVSMCTCTRTGRHLATFTRRLGSSLYTLTTEPSQVAASAQVSTSPAALACPALPPLRRGVAARRSSLLLVSPDNCSPADSPHGHVGPSPRQWTERERYFLLVVDDYTRYTTVFPLRSKDQVVDVLIPWIRTVRLQLRERFGQDLPVLQLHSNRGGEFSSNLFRDFCCREGILQSFTLPDSPQQNGIAERHIGLVMEVARISMIHAAAPHFLWPFAVWYAAHLRAFVRDTSADKLSSYAISCVFLGFVPDAPGWQFYHPTSRRVFPFQDGPALSGVSQVDPLHGPAPVQEVVDSGAARGAASGGAASGGAESEGAESEGAERGVRSLRVLRQGVLSLGVLRLGVVSLGWFVRRTLLRRGASGAGGAGPAGAGGTATTGTGGARTRGTGAAGTGGVEGAGAGDLTESGTTGAGGAGAGGAGVGGPGTGGAKVGGRGVGGAGAEGAGVVDPGGDVRSRPYFVPLLQHVLGAWHARYDPSSFLCSSTFSFTDPSFESAAASALVAEQLDFAAACRLNYATALVAESASASPPSVGGECALGTDVLEDRQEDFESLAAGVPCFASMLLAPEGDLDAPDIPTPHSYAEAITLTPLSGRQPWMPRWHPGFDYFQTSSPTPKMTTLRVLLHVPAQRDYELQSLDFSTAFMQGNLHEEIWLRRPPGFTESFPAGTQWSLRRPVYGLRQAPREWHNTLRTTLTALGFAPGTVDPSLFLRTDTSLPLFYVLVYVDDLVFATADTEALTLVLSELEKRHTCIDLGELRSYLGLQITRDRARRTITLTQSHMVHQVLQRFGFQFSLPQPTPLSTSHSLSAPPLEESIEPSGPYPALVGCLMYLMTCTRPNLAYPLSLPARYVALGRHRKVHWDAAKRVLRYLCSTLGMGLVLGGRGPVVLTSHADASWVDDSATRWSSQGYTFSLGFGSVSWRSTRSSSVLGSSCEAEIYAGAMAAQELRWLTYLLTDLGVQPRSPPVLYVDNKAMIALCLEHRLEH
ncbi:unnamed protein product [Closterium sp. NIES-54]